MWRKILLMVFGKRLDSQKLGEYEIGWWRAHNDRDKERMVKFLVEYNREFYSLSGDDSHAAVNCLAAAAKYHDTRDWGAAERAAKEYYDLILKYSDLGFDSKEVAKLEIGWWRIHDELEHNLDKTRLARAFANLYAAEFRLDSGSLKRAGELKAQATYEHDLAEDQMTAEEDREVHWKKAEENLVEFYRELDRLLNKA